MRLKPTSTRRSPREPDLIGLINVIFLILIFFIIAGTLRPFSERGLQLAAVPRSSPEAVAPARLIAREDGTIVYRGASLTLAELPAALAAAPAFDPAAAFTLIADARLDARHAVAIVTALRQAGITHIAILTERGRNPL